MYLILIWKNYWIAVYSEVSPTVFILFSQHLYDSNPKFYRPKEPLNNYCESNSKINICIICMIPPPQKTNSYKRIKAWKSIKAL